LDSRGPVLYKQVRIGKNGKEFKLLKFRSMRIGSDKKGLLTIGVNDNRITKAGIILRKFKIDELPQLINVLLGDLSLVGPRPEVKKYVDLYNDEQRKVLLVRPGITDYASLIYFDENSLLAKHSNPEMEYIENVMPAKLKINLKYINDYSILNYFIIIFLTILSIVGIKLSVNVEKIR
jgi:lipopolysaccharide/colanic/teichoic acid biosynthesis glycosyltransferase